MKIPEAHGVGGGDENMRVTKVVLGLAGFLLLSLIFVSFQAAAHPDQSDDAIANAEANGAGAPVGSNAAGPGLENGVLGPAFDHQANNPLCPRHPNPAEH